jgi:hypothetical protein
VPSNLTAEDLHQLRMRGARPAAAPPAAPSPAATGTLAAGAVIEVDRRLDADGVTGLAGHRVKVGAELAGKKVTLRLESVSRVFELRERWLRAARSDLDLTFEDDHLG